MPFAYLFARFPSLTQTFCFREVEEMSIQLGPIPIWSLRYPEDFSLDCPNELANATQYLPEHAELRQEIGSFRRMWGIYPVQVIWQIKRWGNRPGKYRLYQAAWLGRRLRAQGITHLHTHFAGMGARTAWWIRKFYGISYSFTGHANDMFCPNDDPLSLENLVEAAEFVVTVSDFSREWLVQKYPAYANSIHRIYNGISISSLPVRQENQVPPLILSVGRAVEKKGFADLIQACAILHSKRVLFRCQIIGGGPLKSDLQAQISRLGLSNLIEMTGPLKYEEVQKRLRHAAIFVLPCVSEVDGGMDCLPTVILEAMKVGLPIVSTNLAAVPEMVEEGVTGLLVNEREPVALAASMRKLLESPELQSKMGLAGYRLAEERYNVKHSVFQLSALVGKACKKA